MAKDNGGAVPVRSATAPLFERYRVQDVLDLIHEYPLAWVCVEGGEVANATLLPLLPEADEMGRLTGLLGHMARRNPLQAALTADPRAWVLFTGPQAYVSPACVSDPTWAPTWNYAQLRIEATVRFQPDVGEALGKLVDAMEAREPSGWSIADMGSRHALMQDSIIAFRAEVVQCTAKFKLGQDESPERLREILSRHQDAALLRWMRRFNASRC